MLSTVLVNPEDDEDLALNLNERKKKINRKDFESAFSTMKLDTKQQTNIFAKMEKVRNKWIDFIQISF
jgi:serine/threonine-protein kinase HipA